MAFIVGPENSAFRFLRDAGDGIEVQNGVILVAWARRVGVGLLHTALGDALRQIDVVVGMAGRGTSAEALALLRTLARRVFVYHKHHRQTFHPKLYLLDDGGDPPADAALLVGSSNLTGGGLYRNIEGNLALLLQPSRGAGDREIYDSVVSEATSIIASPFCEEVTTNDRIRQLLADSYISTERSLERRRQRDARDAARGGPRRQRPEAPPPPYPEFQIPELDVTFGWDNEAEPPPQHTAGELAEPPATYGALLEVADPLDQFYVRTLTVNDVNKLQGRTPGTAEWDIGETARDAMPQFWGWPEEYATVQRRQERLEWATRGVVRSSKTGGTGREIEVVLWFREPREGHAAEHRLRIGPRPVLVEVTPETFNTTSLVVVERLPRGGDYTFLVKLLTDSDPEYVDYARYLRHNRPQHRYGYGS